VARLVVHGGAAAGGEVTVPASKYHAHRALIVGALAEGVTEIEGRSRCGHVRATIACLRRLGIRIHSREDRMTVYGGRLAAPDVPLDAGSSGSTLQFLAGVGALADGPVPFTGSRYLRRRPFTPLLRGLSDLGCRIQSREGGLPFTVTGPLAGGRTTVPGYLSQWVSGLLIPAPRAAADTVIEIDGELREGPYIDLTLEMMARFGARVRRTAGGRTLQVDYRRPYRPARCRLPGDWASAAFLLTLAAITPGSRLVLRRLDAAALHPEREILPLLQRMGADIDVRPDEETVVVRGSRRLEAISLDCRDCPDLLPIVCVAAALARGRSELRHVGHVRHKESDRVAAMLQLRRMGGRLELDGETLVVEGVNRLSGAEVSTCNDHRVAMAFAVAGARAHGCTTLTFPGAHRASYPEFPDHLARLGVKTEVV